MLRLDLLTRLALRYPPSVTPPSRDKKTRGPGGRHSMPELAIQDPIQRPENTSKAGVSPRPVSPDPLGQGPKACQHVHKPESCVVLVRTRLISFEIETN
ncbi:unnamed protein product [Microthlaspi erraticum]|uniref:Uncharacterized protein n=1 Tax=Microthlaspi erraticum TaxID=1685480 RepID=A0A6D2I678_9BRAS|nr:unnamed protein product [Microthlaspi erraticum]